MDASTASLAFPNGLSVGNDDAHLRNASNEQINDSHNNEMQQSDAYQSSTENMNQYVSCAPAPMVEMKLFCGRVPKNMTEDDIKRVFEDFGIVKEVIIIRDKDTNTHKFSAFVRMASLAHADAAIQALNCQRVLDSSLGPLQVKYANGEMAKAHLPENATIEPGVHQAKMFVGSLPKTVTDEQIRELFAPYGTVDEVFIMVDKATGHGKGCAFVKLAFKEQALYAIKYLSAQKVVEGGARPIEVRFAEAKGQKQTQQSFPPYGLPGGGNVPPHSGNPYSMNNAHMPIMHPASHSAPHFAAMPRSFGHWKEYFTQEGRPYYHNEQAGYTVWDKPAEFDHIPMTTGMNSSGGMMSMSGAGSNFGTTDASGPKGANIFVFYVPNEWTQNDLTNAFGSFGNIISARIATDKQTNRNKGYAFVSYDSPQAAASAVHQMNGYSANGKRLKVTIKKGEESYVQQILDQMVHSSGEQMRNPSYNTMSGGGSNAQYTNYVAPRYHPY